MLTDEQKAARLTALTSSDAWALLHPEMWPSLAADILAGRPAKEQTAAMQRGQDQEGPICEAAAALKGWQVHECETVYHPDTPYVLCHPDRIILRQHDEDIAPGVMEAKCPGSAFLAQRYLEQWLTQTHWHLLCTGYTWGRLVVAYGDWKTDALEMKIIPVTRNERLMTLMLELANQFWAMKETLWAMKETLCKVNPSLS